MVDHSKILKYWQQQISIKLRLIFIKFVGIFSPLFGNANYNKIINEYNRDDSYVIMTAAEEQQEPLELPLEMHNEVILFATRETLTTLSEFNNGRSYIGHGVALLAAKRLQSIRERMNNIQRQRIQEFMWYRQELRSRLQHQRRRGPQQQIMDLFPNINHQLLFVGHVLSTNHARPYTLIVITATEIAFRYFNQEGLAAESTGYSTTAGIEIREISPDPMNSHRLQIFHAANGRKRRRTPNCIVDFLCASELKEAFDVLSNHTKFVMKNAPSEPWKFWEWLHTKPKETIIVIIFGFFICVVGAISFPFISALSLQPMQRTQTSIVETTYGKVQGFVALNDSIDVFFGIPFASPPVGQHRFEKPVSPKKWDGILPTMEVRNGCYSHATPDWLNGFLLSGNSSEDCLYLNIFSPHESCKILSLFKPLLPVLVIIHGGGFEIGSAFEFANYTDIGTNFVQHGIVVVSIQYRLGELGFASTGDHVLPGNLGLWDQVAALKFIKANIAKFGGDPDQITLFGQSAGSASVSVLGCSPHSRNLFQKAIQLSGSSTASFVYGSRVAKETEKLGHVLGCQPKNSTALKQCLNATTAQGLLAGVDNMGPTRPEPNPIVFGPRFDGDFFPVDIPKLIKQAPPKPTIVGFTRLEALIFTFLTGMNSTLSSQQLPWSVAGTYSANDFLDYINNQVAYVERFGNAQGNVAQQIFAYYTNANNGQTRNSTFYIRAYTQLISDLMFVESIIGETKQKAAHKWPIYLYESTYANEAQFPPAVEIHESTHMNDMNYVFNFPFVSYSFNAQDLKIQAFMQESFRNFIKTGNPSTSESIQLQWPKVPRNGELVHVDIRAPEPVVLNNLTYVQNSFNFWTRLTAEFPQYNLVREIPGTV